MIGGELPDKSVRVESLQLLIFYRPPVAIFVVAGAMMAPRYRRTTVVVLTVLAITPSLTIHVLLPESVSANNYKHFAAETTGAIAAAVFVFFTERRLRTRQSRGDGLPRAADS